LSFRHTNTATKKTFSATRRAFWPGKNHKYFKRLNHWYISQIDIGIDCGYHNFNLWGKNTKCNYIIDLSPLLLTFLFIRHILLTSGRDTIVIVSIECFCTLLKLLNNRIGTIDVLFLFQVKWFDLV
jgi:hypothetical protein